MGWAVRWERRNPLLSNNSGPLIWTIVERFYRSHRTFMGIHARYESIVAEYVDRLEMPREKIRLGARELSELLKYKELEVLRDDYLSPLKEACHRLFRTKDSTDILDRLINDIFHELSILKEEHYNVLTYDADQTPAAVPGEGGLRKGFELQLEQQAVLDEVHAMFPAKVHRIHHLFEVSLSAVEALMPQYRENRVLIRSLFLHRHRFVARVYEEGLNRFYQLMYGEDRIFDGFTLAGDSFYHSGFYDEAICCYEEGEAYLQSVAPSAKRKLNPSWKEARDHFKRGKRKARLHQHTLQER